jgi:threonine dehydratase
LRAWLKLESLQRTGSFKLRGACVALSALARRGERAFIAASAGNHGLGVACAGRALGLKAHIVAPANAAEKKREGIVALGATLSVEGADYDEAEAIAKERAARDGLSFVSPFDDDAVIAGNGAWLGRELMAQRPSLRRVVVPVGGGGLAAGLLAALAPRGVEVLGVQPKGANAMARSLESGAAILVDHGATICSGLDGGVAERTFVAARDHGLGIAIVDESSILPAIAFAYRTLGQLVEPASAVVIAAALAGVVPIDEETALVITGGNLDTVMLDRALAVYQR